MKQPYGPLPGIDPLDHVSNETIVLSIRSHVLHRYSMSFGSNLALMCQILRVFNSECLIDFDAFQVRH